MPDSTETRLWWFQLLGTGQICLNPARAGNGRLYLGEFNTAQAVARGGCAQASSVTSTITGVTPPDSVKVSKVPVSGEAARKELGYHAPVVF